MLVHTRRIFPSCQSFGRRRIIVNQSESSISVRVTSEAPGRPHKRWTGIRCMSIQLQQRRVINNNDNIILSQQPFQSRWNATTTSSSLSNYYLNVKDCQTVEEAVKITYDQLPYASHRNLSAFWSVVPKLLKKNNGSEKMQDVEQLNHQINHILGHTMEQVHAYNHIDLTQTALAFAKIVKEVGDESLPRDSPSRILNDVFIGGINKEFIFKVLAVRAMSILHEFDARHLSNLIYAYGLAEVIVKYEDGSTFFDILAQAAIPNLKTFEPQGFSIMLWAYATAKVPNPQLFKEVGDIIVELDSLEDYWPQGLSNIVWSYATLGESHPKLFTKIADHMVQLDNLDYFWPQALSNITWAYSIAKESNPSLFQKISDAAIKRRNEFTSQGVADLLWAFATNGQLDNNLFISFEPVAASFVTQCSGQDLANIGWAYAVAKVEAPSLFNDDFINVCVDKEDEFEIKELRQLYQWHTWQEEIKSGISLPPSFQKRCHDSFISTETDI